MKFIFSFFIALGLMFGFAPEAKAHTVQTTVVQKVCSVQKQYVAGHYNRRGIWVRGHFKRVVICRNVPRTVVRRVHHHRRHRHRRGPRFVIRL
jgi:hypothetical protein